MGALYQRTSKMAVMALGQLMELALWMMCILNPASPYTQITSGFPIPGRGRNPDTEPECAGFN